MCLLVSLCYMYLLDIPFLQNVWWLNEWVHEHGGSVSEYISIEVLAHIWSWSWWRHQMETFSALLALCAGNSPVPVNSPHKGQWRGALMFSLIWAWINNWVNNREAGDLRRYRGHYDVSVMIMACYLFGAIIGTNANLHLIDPSSNNFSQIWNKMLKIISEIYIYITIAVYKIAVYKILLRLLCVM